MPIVYECVCTSVTFYFIFDVILLIQYFIIWSQIGYWFVYNVNIIFYVVLILLNVFWIDKLSSPEARSREFPILLQTHQKARKDKITTVWSFGTFWSFFFLKNRIRWPKPDQTQVFYKLSWTACTRYAHVLILFAVVWCE